MTHKLPRRESTTHGKWAAVLLLCLSAPSASAYIDPNAGGLLYQILLPLIVAVTAGWRYIKMTARNLMHRLTAKPAVNPERAETDPRRDADDTSK
jgi:hypothetical protein